MYHTKKIPEGWCIVRNDGEVHKYPYPNKKKALENINRLMQGLIKFQPTGKF